MKELTDNEMTALSVFEEGVSKTEWVTRVVDKAELAERTAKATVTNLAKKGIITEGDEPGLTDEGAEVFETLQGLEIEVNGEDDDLMFSEDDVDEEEEPPTTMVKAAAKKAKRKADTADLKAAATGKGPKKARFDHSQCGHATEGAEGKKARAACRREHAKAEATK